MITEKRKQKLQEGRRREKVASKGQQQFDFEKGGLSLFHNSNNPKPLEIEEDHKRFRVN